MDENLDEVLNASTPEDDYIDKKYRYEYSEETREVLKKYGKPSWENDGEPSSLDPVNDLEAYYNFNLRLPPKAYDAVQEAAREEIADLQFLKDVKLPEEKEETIRYRTNLMQGTAEPDVKWLKLKAYHRGKALARLVEEEKKTLQGERERLEAAGVPLDVVPAELVNLTPAELVERRAKSKLVRLPRVADPVYSEDSEWDPEWQSTSLWTGSFQKQLSAFLNQQLAPSPAQQPGSVASSSKAEASEEEEVIHGYNPNYIRQVQLEIKLREQKRLQKIAFWLALATVSATYLWKSWRSFKQGRKKPKTAKAKAKVQP